jgi:hypothetical protein
VEVAIGPFMVEEKSDEMLNQDKSSEAMNRTSEEVG